MTKYSFLNELNQLLNELPAAERLAFAKRAKRSNAEVIMLTGAPTYWYIGR